MSKKPKEDAIIINPNKNYYDIMPEEFKDRRISYPNESKIKISLPANIMVLGFTGTMKTNFLMNFIDTLSAFDHFTLYAKKLYEPMYKFLISNWEKAGEIAGKKIYEAFDNLDNIIPTETYSKDDNNLIIIDDMESEPKKTLAKLVPLFIAARKDMCTVIWIGQNYFNTPITFRNQLSYIFIMKVKDMDDLGRILRGCSSKREKEVLLKLYKYMRTLGPTHFLTIDFKTSEEPYKFRIDYKPVKIPE